MTDEVVISALVARDVHALIGFGMRAADPVLLQRFGPDQLGLRVVDFAGEAVLEVSWETPGHPMHGNVVLIPWPQVLAVVFRR